MWVQILKLKRFGQPHAAETYINDISKYIFFCLWVSSVFNVSTDSEVEEIWTATCCGNIHHWLSHEFFICKCQVYLMWVQIWGWKRFERPHAAETYMNEWTICPLESYILKTIIESRLFSLIIFKCKWCVKCVWCEHKFRSWRDLKNHMLLYC